jgi:hypothetical protein
MSNQQATEGRKKTPQDKTSYLSGFLRWSPVGAVFVPFFFVFSSTTSSGKLDGRCLGSDVEYSGDCGEGWKHLRRIEYTAATL